LNSFIELLSGQYFDGFKVCQILVKKISVTEALEASAIERFASYRKSLGGSDVASARAAA
jgi:hypothetical protein